ncbi:alcohol dehydrogenase [Pleurostoma richardsiae]|uniref:Alcohol dehydrogenase n=1 Tax=Pleurostoma richardsiae TaxID=41990 RepID=A0AA38S2V2_9PEZI|nr:alcohol dehydrogenase [Pleurostoma richardsiae]
MTEAQSFVLPDGRTLCYAFYGLPPTQSPESDQPSTAFYFHGSPGSHYEGQAAHDGALKRGVRIVAVSRPGYGGSSYNAQASLASFARDVLALADHLGIQRFVVMGVSGGGPYALACVHEIPPSRLAGTVVVSGMYPCELGMSGMMLSNRILFSVAPYVPRLVSYVSDWSVGKQARDRDHPERLENTLALAFKGGPEEEIAQADDGKILKLIVKSAREAFCDGAEGWACEAKLFGSPWGFELAELQVEEGKLLMYHGGKDINIPLRMAEKAAGMIPNAQLKVEPDESHLSLAFHKVDEIMDAIVTMLG